MRRERPILIGEKDGRPGALGRWGRRLKWAVVALAVASCAGFSMSSLGEEMRVRQAELDVSRIGHAARLFRADFGRCPTGVAELTAPPEGRVPYVRTEKDPWQRPYRLTCPARLDPTEVDVISGGPDGERTGDDNISSL